MVRRSNVSQPSSIWCVCVLALASFGAWSGSLRSEERLAGNQPVSDESGGLSFRIDVGDPSMLIAEDPKLRYLIEELITQRLENARLTVELTGAMTKAAEIKEVARQRAGLLTALMNGLSTQDCQGDAADSRARDLRQRLETTQAELHRMRVYITRLATDLAAAHRAADSATIIALENLASIEAQLAVLKAAKEDVAVERAHLPAEFLSAALVETLPAIPLPKPRLESPK